MSSYQSDRTRMVAQAAQGICTALNSTETEVAAMLTAQRALAAAGQLHAEGTVQTIGMVQALPLEVRTTVGKLAPFEWDRAAAALAGVVPDAAVVAPAATDAVGAVRAALDAADAAVGRATRTGMVGQIERFHAAAPGTFTTRVDSVDHSVIQAERDNGEIVRYRIDDHGGVERDYLQHEGVSCVERDAEFREYMRANGFLLESVAADVHGGKRDGARIHALEGVGPSIGLVVTPRRRATSPVRRTSGGAA